MKQPMNIQGCSSQKCNNSGAGVGHVGVEWGGVGHVRMGKVVGWGGWVM